MIVTIGREHGSNGHDIALALAEQLHYQCYDKEIVDKAAETSNFSKEVLQSYDEKRVAPYIVTMPHFVGLNEGFRLNMQLASAQFQAIRDLADEGNCIFVGRCADYVLRDREDLLRVFIMADEGFRVKTMMERKDLTEEQAHKLIKQVDKDRGSYYKYYTDQVWGEKENFDLCINSGKTGVQGAVQIIKAYIDAVSGGSEQ
ncbi:MAG: cytidylate kinase-like family protein [Oscillospiraceae bacterium]|nr:cytidylate kinase-like family protein [Oscillospiraceae bacterium]